MTQDLHGLISGGLRLQERTTVNLNKEGALCLDLMKSTILLVIRKTLEAERNPRTGLGEDQYHVHLKIIREGLRHLERTTVNLNIEGVPGLDLVKQSISLVIKKT